ncbi:hypothetical protein [Cellulomonas sp.]|nr:hypothetical protein [Cellulomonas sp.]MBO9556755.1 hypothetical protein [Cellulomonas sp.]
MILRSDVDGSTVIPTLARAVDPVVVAATRLGRRLDGLVERVGRRAGQQ